MLAVALAVAGAHAQTAEFQHLVESSKCSQVPASGWQNQLALIATSATVAARLFLQVQARLQVQACRQLQVQASLQVQACRPRQVQARSQVQACRPRQVQARSQAQACPQQQESARSQGWRQQELACRRQQE